MTYSQFHPCYITMSRPEQVWILWKWSVLYHDKLHDEVLYEPCPCDIPLNINVRPLLTTMCFSDLSNYEIRLISHINFFLSLTDRWGSDSDPGSNTLSGQIHDSPPSQRTAIQGNNGRSLRWQTLRLQEMNLHMSAGRRYNSFS